jgi:hypothetical protein
LWLGSCQSKSWLCLNCINMNGKTWVVNVPLQNVQPLELRSMDLLDQNVKWKVYAVADIGTWISLLSMSIKPRPSFIYSHTINDVSIWKRDVTQIYDQRKRTMFLAVEYIKDVNLMDAVKLTNIKPRTAQFWANPGCISVNDPPPPPPKR